MWYKLEDKVVQLRIVEDKFDPIFKIILIVRQQHGQKIIEKNDL